MKECVKEMGIFKRETLLMNLVVGTNYICDSRLFTVVQPGLDVSATIA